MVEEKEELRVPIRRNSEPKPDVKLVAEYNQGLSKFRQQVKAPAKKGKVDFQTKGGRKKYDYVLLDDLIKSIDDGVKGTGISWSQEVETIKSGVRVRTLINADNGYQYVSPWLTLQSSTNPQDIGSAITYARRYSLGTTFGINSEADDDGEKANESTNKSNAQSTTNRKPTKPLANEAVRNELKKLIEQVSQKSNTDKKTVIKDALKKARVASWTNMSPQDAQYLKKELNTELMELQQDPQAGNKPVKTTPALLNTINNLSTTLAKNHDTDPKQSIVALEKKMKHDFTKLTDEQAQEVITYLTKKLNEESQVGVK